jgi:ribose 5-phosphate isomerase B
MTRRVITEREIRQAASQGLKAVSVTGALVTPGARELAKQLGIELSTAAEPPRSAARPAAPARPTPVGTIQVAPAQQVAKPTPAHGVAAPTPQAQVLSVILGADQGGVALRELVVARLRELGHQIATVAQPGGAPAEYPEIAVTVAKAVAEGRAEFGIIIDATGIGSCMAANKISGARAALCHDVTTAASAREHTNANILTIGGGLVGPTLAFAIIETFLATPFAGGRAALRVAKIDALDHGR